MRQFTALIAVLALSTATSGQTLPDARIVRLNDRVYVLHGPIQHANRVNLGYMINATVIVGDKGVILVDSGGTLEVGQHIAKSVRQITRKPVMHVVNTHHHGDHYLGNVAFEGATFISSEGCRRMVVETGHEWLAIMEKDTARTLTGTRPIAAQLTYPENSRNETVIDGVRLVFWVPRGSHTVGDLMVYLPEDRVLVAGDVLVNGIVPTLQDGFLKNWIRTLEEIRALDVLHFVPGHGDVMTTAEVTDLHAAMLRFYAGVSKGYEKGLTEADIRRSLDLSTWEAFERSYVIGRNINRAYLEIESHSFDK